MWFDAQTALAKLEGDKAAEAEYPDPAFFSMQENKLPAHISAKLSALPSAPPTCAVCGQSDWKVAVTMPDGRKLHLICGGRDG